MSDEKDLANAFEEGKKIFESLPEEIQSDISDVINDLLSSVGYNSIYTAILHEASMSLLRDLIEERLTMIDMKSRRLALRYAVRVLQKQRAEIYLNALKEPPDEEMENSTIDLYAIERVDSLTDTPLYFVCFVPENGDNKAAYDDLGHAAKFTTVKTAKLFLKKASFEKTHRIHQFTFREATRHCEQLLDKLVFHQDIQEEDLAGILSLDSAVVI